MHLPALCEELTVFAQEHAVYTGVIIPSCCRVSVTNLVLAQLDLRRYWNETTTYQEQLSTSWRHSSMSKWRHCTFRHSGPVRTVLTQRDSWIHCGPEYPGHKKSELRAHQMARNCGVPGSLRKKSELSSHQMAHPGQLRTKNPS